MNSGVPPRPHKEEQLFNSWLTWNPTENRRRGQLREPSLGFVPFQSSTGGRKQILGFQSELVLDKRPSKKSGMIY